MSVAKRLLLEQWDHQVEPTLEEQFEEALARKDVYERRRKAPVEMSRNPLRLVVNNRPQAGLMLELSANCDCHPGSSDAPLWIRCAIIIQSASCLWETRPTCTSDMRLGP